MRKIILCSSLLLTFSLSTITCYAIDFNISRLTDDTSWDYANTLYGNTVAWVKNSQIYYWDGNSIIQIVNTPGTDPIQSPSLWNGTIAFCKQLLSDNQLLYWDGNNITQIWNNSNLNYPSLHNGALAWQADNWDGYYNISVLSG